MYLIVLPMFFFSPPTPPCWTPQTIDGKEEKILEQRRALSQTVNKLRESYESLVVKFPSLSFEYT